MTPPTPQIRIQPRDLEVLRKLYDSRLMSTSQLAAVLGVPCSQGFEVRLRNLNKAKYLTRPANTQDGYRMTEAKRLDVRLHSIYALGDEGARCLAKVDGLPISKSSWARLNREIKPTQIYHALAASNFRACLYAAMPQVAGGKFPYRWFQGDMLTLRFTASTAGGSQECVIRPDAFMAFMDDANPKSQVGTFFMVEIDRSTVRGTASNPKDGRDGSRDPRMLVKYKDYWRCKRENAQRHHPTFKDVENFVVLTVCKSVQRRNNLMQLAMSADDRQTGSRLFRFASETDFSLENPSSILEPIWYAPTPKPKEAKGERLW